MQASAHFGAKNVGFFQHLRCPHGQGGRVNFSRFCADVFYERLLIKSQGIKGHGNAVYET